MTSIRKKLEGNFLTKGDISFFLKHFQEVPLCCFEIKKANGKILMRCDYLDWATPEVFRELCLSCQFFIFKTLREKKLI